MANSAQRLSQNSKPSVSLLDPINWRAGCVNRACPVRREGELTLSLPLSVSTTGSGWLDRKTSAAPKAFGANSLAARLMPLLKEVPKRADAAGCITHQQLKVHSRIYIELLINVLSK